MNTAASNNPSKVLLVENNLDDLRLVRESLSEMSSDPFDLIAVNSHTEAVARLAEETIDVILLALALPDETGLEILTQMRAAVPHLPIVVVTEGNDETGGLQAVRAGAQDYLVKDNLDSRLLKRILRNAIERKRADQAQREGEARYRSLFENMLNGFAYCRMEFDQGHPQDFVYLEVNTAFETLTGLKNVVGKKVSEVIPGIQESDPALFESYGRVALTGQPETLEIYVASLAMWFSIAIYSPQKEYFVAVFEVITERKRAEEALRASETRFRALIEKSSEAILLTNAEGQVIYDSPSVKHITGYGPAEGPQRLMFDQVHPDDRVRMAQLFTQILEQPGEAVMTQLRIRHKDGSWRWIEGVSTNFLNEPSVAAVIINYRDVTERKRTEEELARYRDHLEQLVEARTAELNRAKTRLEAILNNTTDGIILASRQQGIEQANATFNTLFACEQDAYFGQSLLNLVHPDDRDRLAVLIEAVSADQLGRRGEYRGLRADQTVFEARVGIGSVPVNGVLNAGLVCSVQNISELKQRERLLREFQQMLHTVLETLPVRVFWKDRDSILLGGNRLFAQDAGFTSSDQLVGKSDVDFASRSHATEYRANDQSVIESGLPRIEIEEQMTRADGSTVWVQTNKSPLRDSSGQIIGLIGAYVEITKLKQAEEALQHALEQQKDLVDLKARFISMASHDFRNPMSVILSSISLLEMQINRQFGAEQVEPLQKRLHRIDESVQQMTSLLDDVLTVNRADGGKVEIHPQPLEVEGFCRGILEEIQETASVRHVLNFSFVGEVSRILADKQLWRQILINLLSNAVKYSPEGGNIRLDVRCEPENVEFRVQDNGIGIPEADQARLFETFHRAHNVGEIKGTGLGMAIVKRAVDALQGTIIFESQPGVGTTFTVQLPTAAQIDGSSS